MARIRRTDNAGNDIEFAKYFPGIPQFDNDPKNRRLRFMKFRYTKPKCNCGKVAKYQLNKQFWCNGHLPPNLRAKLDMDYQMINIILPYAFYLDGSN